MSKRWDMVPTNDLTRMYRRVFSSPHGEAVLNHILYDLGVFQPFQDDSDVVLKEYGQRLLDILAGGEVDENSINTFVRQLVRQPLPKETPDD